MRRRLPAMAIACVLTAYGRLAVGQGSALAPPKLSTPVSIEDPRAPGSAAARVLLELDIDREGDVQDARIVESSGDDALDSAAIEAAMGFSFEPATRDGTPIPARIRYEHVFDAIAAPPPPVTEDAPPVELSATARVEAPPREPTKRTLTRDEMASLAGTRGDPVRAIELMPGVSRAAGVDGPPILRGANPSDSSVNVEGAPVPTLYHLGGLSSIVHSRVTEAVDLYPSNFDVRYGRKVGGIIDLRLRDPRRDGFHAIADVNLIESSLVLETPVGDHVATLAAVRRSNLDAFLNAAANSADLAITSAPVYWDYQTVTAWTPTDRDRFRFLAYGGSDRLAIFLKKPASSEPALSGDISNATLFHRAQIGYRHRFAGGSETNTEITYGWGQIHGAFGDAGNYNEQAHTLQGRSELVAVVSPALRVVAGLDLLATHAAGHYEGPPPTADEGADPPPLSVQGRVSLDAARWIFEPGAYLQAGFRPWSRLLVTPGVRADYSDLVKRGSVDPRLSVRFEVTDETTLKAGLGRYSQAAEIPYALEPIGNPHLELTTATHLSAGVERTISDRWSVGVEGFAKWLDHVVTGTPNGEAPYFTNNEIGRVFGGELLVKARPTSRLYGFLSYTLMRSERRDTGENWRLFERDQPHILGTALTYQLGRGWEVSASYRFTSGTPYTPVASSSYDATHDVYVPRYGDKYSARNPPFSRLDLRVQKTWTFSKWSLAAYVDVQNVLNASNAEGFQYTYDYRTRQGADGLPILPSLGLRGEL